MPAGLYRSGYRGWLNVKNPGYWRRESEIEQMQRRRERDLVGRRIAEETISKPDPGPVAV
jgi:hypothetical protein